MLRVGPLRRANETEPGIAERYPIVRIPPPQHPARDFRRDAAHRRSVVNPAWRRKANPGLPVGFVHVFDLNPADLVGEVMVLRRLHGIGKGRQVQLLQRREKQILMLTAKDAEHHACRRIRVSARHQCQDETGGEAVVEVRNRDPLIFNGYFFSHGCPDFSVL